MNKMQASYRLHECPARCGAMVEHDLYACPPDWARLPQELKEAILDGYRKGPLSHAHIEAMTAGRRWYTTHPREDHPQ